MRERSGRYVRDQGTWGNRLTDGFDFTRPSWPPTQHFTAKRRFSALFTPVGALQAQPLRVKSFRSVELLPPVRTSSVSIGVYS